MNFSISLGTGKDYPPGRTHHRGGGCKSKNFPRCGWPPPSSKPTLPLIRVTECHSFFIKFKPYFTAILVYTEAIASYNFKTHHFFLFFILTISYIFLFITSFLAHFYLHYNHGAKTCQLGPTSNTQFKLINQLTFFKQAPGHELFSTSSIKY